MVTRKAIDPHPASRPVSDLQEPVPRHAETHFGHLNGLIAPTLHPIGNIPPHREHSTPSGTFHPIGNIPPDQNGLNLPDQVESSSTQAQMRGLPSRRGTSAAENCACATAHARHASGTQEVGVRATNRAQKPTRHAPRHAQARRPFTGTAGLVGAWHSGHAIPSIRVAHSAHSAHTQHAPH